MTMNRIENILKLFSVPSIGSYKARQLISIFGSAEKALSANHGQLRNVPGVGKKIAQNLKDCVNTAFVEKQMKASANGNQKIISFWDKKYPKSLKNIYDPPVLIFYLGNIELLNKKALAVVGTREITEYGKQALDRLIKPLKGWDITIISGMARGIDSYAHQLCLKQGIPTVGVIAHGLERIYPPENISIWKQMNEQNLILSEYPIGAKLDPRNFPRRNRIISGLSQGTLVIQAGEKSGALITADYATEQNRDVLAVPGPIHIPQSIGPNKLIADGAIPIHDLEVLKEWIGMKKAPSEIEATPDIPLDLDDRLAVIYKEINFDPMHVDQLAFNCQSSTSDILGKLLELELSGHIRQLPGKMFVRSH